LLWMKLFPELRRIDTIQSEPDLSERKGEKAVTAR
jgi:hypothetical protein